MFSVAADLGLSRAEPVLVIEKLFLEDDNPVILTRNCIPTKIISVNDGRRQTADRRPTKRRSSISRRRSFL